MQSQRSNLVPETLEFLYMIQPTQPDMLSVGLTAEETNIMSDHFNYLKDLTEKGVVVLAGRTLNTDSSTFGIVIFKADSDSSARKIVESDPAVKHGLMRAELFPYRVALITNIRES
jgi:uncharacterized protein YciI